LSSQWRRCGNLRSEPFSPSGDVGGKGKPLAGGNTDNVYNTNDFRRAFAESLAEQHPDVAKVVWKFGRWHHEVDYSPFKGNKLVRRADVTPTVGNDDYGMKLVYKG